MGFFNIIFVIFIFCLFGLKWRVKAFLVGKKQICEKLYCAHNDIYCL